MSLLGSYTTADIKATTILCIHYYYSQDSFSCQPWSTKASKLAQPNLNFIAPEVQSDRKCSTISDIFSLGMTVCAIYNGGQSLINAEHNSQMYTKQLDQVCLPLMLTLILDHS